MESTQLPTEPQRQRPRLERLRSDRAVAGVASGLARYLDVDVAWVRIAFVVAALFGGTGVLMYLVGWIAMPEEGESDSIATHKTRNFENAGSWIGVGLIVLAAMIIVGNTGLIDGDLVFAAVLIVIGFLLYRGDIGGFASRSDESDDQPAYTPAATSSAVVDTADSSPGDTLIYGRDSEEPVAPPIPASPPAPPPPPDPAFQPRPGESRQSSGLGRLAVATVLIVIGVIGVGQSAGWWQPEIRHYVGSIFVVLGVALVVGSILGRARWLIVVGFISAPLLFGAALLDVPLEGGFGDPDYTPLTASDLNSEYRLVGGEMILDLSGLDLAAGEVYEVGASVVFGRLEIRIPDDMGVELSAELDAGEMRFDGSVEAEGLNAQRTRIYDGSGLIKLDAHVGFGQLEIFEVEEVSP